MLNEPKTERTRRPRWVAPWKAKLRWPFTNTLGVAFEINHENRRLLLRTPEYKKNKYNFIYIVNWFLSSLMVEALE